MIVLSQFLAWEQALYWGNSLDLLRSQEMDASGERREPRVDWRICATKQPRVKWRICATKHTMQKEPTPLFYILSRLSLLQFPIAVEMNLARDPVESFISGCRSISFSCTEAVDAD